MSRVSRKSELSPASTRGNNSINLGKNSGIDLGKKTQPSVTSGGIGITQEVTSVGGMTVSAGANIDITPLDFGINVNPAEGTVSVATGAEIPGGILGVSGGIEVDLNTGEVIGGSIGGEALGLGINISNSKKGGLGVEFTVQIPGTPIELSLGFGFPPKEPSPTPAQPPPGTPSADPSTGPQLFPDPNYPIPTLGKNCTVYVGISEIHYHYAPNNSIFLKVYQEGGNADFVNGNRTSLASGKITTTSLLTGGGTVVQPLSYSEKHVSYIGYRENRLYNVSHSFYVDTNGRNVNVFAVSGKEEDIYSYIKSLNYSFTEKRFDQTIIRQLVHNILASNCGSSSPSLPETPGTSTISPFPNPPPRRQTKMDACCRENLAFLRAIYTKLGLARFPGQLPNTIIQEVPKEGEEPAEPPQVPIPDLVTLLNWQFERDDERWGQWKVEIDIKDSDITKEGDQKKQIKLPNLAESIAEFEGQLLSIMTNVDALVALQIKVLAESGMARQEAIKGYLASKAIIKYMAFKSTEVDMPIPMTFTAGAETISELLKESEGHIKGTDYVEKETLRDICLDLLQAAAITRAVHWQRIDTKTDTKSQLLSILKGSVDLAASITKASNGENGEKPFDPDNNFEDFIDSVEDGFRNTTGITDIQNPYGKPPNRRPRIRQIGDNISQAGGND